MTAQFIDYRRTESLALHCQTVGRVNRSPSLSTTKISEVTLEQLDKQLLPLTMHGLLEVHYSAAQATTFYKTPSGRMVGMTCKGHHYAQVPL